MRRRHRQDDPTVSLFPFLTVLICTIGMLIVLLVISVRAVGSKSQKMAEDAAESHRKQVVDIQADLDLNELRQEGWTEIREKLVHQVRAARDERVFLQQANLDLETEAAAVASQLKVILEKSELTGDQVALREQVHALELQVADAKAAAERAPLKPMSAPAVYNLVPYRGPNGTNRRPIYVECIDQKLILQPSNIVLKLDEIPVPNEPGNPLDAALTTAKEYWKQFDLAGETAAPYPLLVVRPSGSQAYALARRAMTSWVDEFGYELIPEDIKLNFGPADTQLAAEMRQAIELSRVRQIALAKELATRERIIQQRAIAKQMASGAGGLRADRVRGGFVADSRNVPTSPERHSTNTPEQTTSTPPRSLSARSDSSARPISTVQDSQNQEHSSWNSTSSALANESTAQGVPGGSLPVGSLAPSSLEPLSQKRGVDWALPGKTAGRATAYLRPIRVYCASDQFTIDSGPQFVQAARSIPVNGATSTAVDSLVASLWAQIDSWGQTPDNGYWKPVLKIKTLPGGELRRAELEVLLRDSGIEISIDESPEKSQ